ncbi:thermopsin family protease [Acidianus sulfidivorans]|uniref:thermopsin family protease n=1 Tax=Acidianus sulfidivorans TaxID=312539 RepID=UPI001F106BB7|nr:thermopsin family protease [Acidianus sulfidivorans]
MTSLLAYSSNTSNYTLSFFTSSSVFPIESTVPRYGASLQLNVMLQANSTYGTYYFWLQNIAQFYTNHKLVAFPDNIWYE